MSQSVFLTTYKQDFSEEMSRNKDIWINKMKIIRKILWPYSRISVSRTNWNRNSTTIYYMDKIIWTLFPCLEIELHQWTSENSFKKWIYPKPNFFYLYKENVHVVVYWYTGKSLNILNLEFSFFMFNKCYSNVLSKT